MVRGSRTECPSQFIPNGVLAVDRTEFMKCALGMCSCAALAFLPKEATAAESRNAETDALTWKLEAVHTRFAKLISILNENLDEPTKKRVLESLGRECAKQYSSLTDKYKGDIQGFLRYIQSQWVEKAEYDETAGTIRIIDKSRTCTCPFVQQGLTPGDFCSCTLGWQKETYSKILGKPVEADLEESLLRGGTRCVYRIR